MARLMLLAALFIALAAAAFYFGLGAGGEAPQSVEAMIGETRFSYPPAFARDEATAAGGYATRLAFVASFPDFAPLVADPGASPERSPSAKRDRVLITVTAKDDGMDPKERPKRLYARFLESEAEVGREGLVMRRFEQGSPYDLEQLHVAPPDGREFFARCPKSQTVETRAEDFCMFLFRDGAVDVELRFAPALLDQWETLNEGARAFVARVKSPPPLATDKKQSSDTPAKKNEENGP